MRRIIAEDFDWSLAIVPTLSDICLHCIVKNFEEQPIFEELTSTEKDFLQEKLSLSIPLSVTANLVSDGNYWKRCCEQRWDFCEVSNYGNSWKRMYFERHLVNIIELFIPAVTDPKAVLNIIPLCRNYVKKLNISQLLPPVLPPQQEEEDDSDLALKNKDDEPSIDHFDFSILLDKLTNLEELRLVYKVKQCGMNFEWNMFEMSDRDCESLAKALQSCKTLKILSIKSSYIDDKKCRLLMKYLLDHPSLKELDLSYNEIGDSGARGICNLLTRSKLEILNMCDNRISCSGAKAIAHMLSKEDSTLLSLNLRLNRVRDEGGQAIGEALLNNRTLLDLHLGANVMTEHTAFTLSKVLLHNKTLKTINLSCNKLGELGVQALKEAMSANKSLIECDISLTEEEEETASLINQVV
ncbi:dynein regulatory complex subunit 5 [Parambassis ranga]|uniref:Dynein regulatory complex subunit 5 n=1 Tax=Parambassis ranga TaxID=210632 RepID=A0A6P7HN54_9TELE|nr:dynein regulatory complex subunit 5 [Parambassis ranga]